MATTDPFAEQILTEQKVVDAQGQSRPLHSHTEAGQCELIHRLVRDVKPMLSVEVGLAYGVSTLTICHALRSLPPAARRHVVMDPFQKAHWDNIGLLNISRAGYDDLVDFREQYAHDVLPDLVKEGTPIDFAYLDGSKVFDVVLINVFYLTRAMRVGGLIVMDDCEFPGIRRVCDFLTVHPGWELAETWGERGERPQKGGRIARFIRSNPRLARRLGVNAERPEPHARLRNRPHCVVYRKVKNDDRPWNWHVEF